MNSCPGDILAFGFWSGAVVGLLFGIALALIVVIAVFGRAVQEVVDR